MGDDDNQVFAVAGELKEYTPPLFERVVSLINLLVMTFLGCAVLFNAVQARPAGCECDPVERKHGDIFRRLTAIEGEHNWLKEDATNYDRRLKRLERRAGFAAGDLPAGSPIGDEKK